MAPPKPPPTPAPTATAFEDDGFEEDVIILADAAFVGAGDVVVMAVDKVFCGEPVD